MFEVLFPFITLLFIGVLIYLYIASFLNEKYPSRKKQKSSHHSFLL